MVCVLAVLTAIFTSLLACWVENFVINILMVFSSKILQKPSLAKGLGKAWRLYLIVMASLGSGIVEALDGGTGATKPVLRPNAQNAIFFVQALHVPRIGRDTELQASLW